MLTAVRKTIRMIDVDIFFLVQIMVGSCWGLHMNFFSFYVDMDLKASKSLFGIVKIDQKLNRFPYFFF